MTRIQVLPLTPRTVGSVSHTPFALVIDQLTPDPFGELNWTNELLDQLKASTGAVAVLVDRGELTVANVDEDLQRLAQQAVDQILAARVVDVAGMCHWVQDRGGVQRQQSHEAFHFLHTCPYAAVAAVLAGEPDPREAAGR